MSTSNNENKNFDMNNELSELLKIKFSWFQLQKISLVTSLIGLFLATMIAGTGYLFYKNLLIRMFYLASAMGCLASSVVGINIMDRLKKQKFVPYIPGIIILAIVIGALLFVFVKSKPYKIPIDWPVMISVIYTAIMIGVLWSLRDTEKSIKQKEKSIKQNS